MNVETIMAFAKERIELHETGCEDIEDIIDNYWERLTDFIVSDIAGAIEFMTKSPMCTGEIFSDWSEGFEDVAMKSQSKEFVDALSIAAKRFPEACEQYNIASFIDGARSQLS